MASASSALSWLINHLGLYLLLVALFVPVSTLVVPTYFREEHDAKKNDARNSSLYDGRGPPCPGAADIPIIL